MDDIQKNRIIAFIDILGFKKLINGAEKNKVIEFLYELRDIDSKFEEELIKCETLSGEMGVTKIHPDISSYSDHILISAPINLDSLQSIITSLAYISYTIIDIQLLALKRNFALRGAIAHGEMFYDDEKKIFAGQALIEAIENESLVAKYPRIIISKSVKDLFENKKLDEIEYNFLIKDFDGIMFLNFLNAKYVSQKFKDSIEAELNLFKDIIQKNIEKSKGCIAILSKWEWLENYYNLSVDRINKYSGN
ncbi:hypothetical protein G5T09_02160 [Legionella pneumophila serogroup 1]|uniref:hypothetical protein n=1 Tax=Legionella pneumophila TaxID=446 RepID=UPI001A303AD6|nr:hypothetical protein [Legionella pneumophila]HAT9741611.1 hypothetical protein [Legionella pneumophila subsp. pneumophila]MCH9059794.1 hypothetical protein [Legionella pneumophila serogroup 1]MCH9071802.1 hypothetical protein [Legionella pneumophila serogroup 1]MCH9077832.1 hypothetical protein [Legionella pneumophila serogroup 1]MCH9080756.1 hypothetical protein [Legionella pneumophila serogroup 1]